MAIYTIKTGLYFRIWYKTTRRQNVTQNRWLLQIVTQNRHDARIPEDGPQGTAVVDCVQDLQVQLRALKREAQRYRGPRVCAVGTM